MRKIILITALLLSTLFYAQKNPTTLSTYYSGGKFTQLGLSLETGKSKNDKKHFTAYVVNLGLNYMEYEVDNFNASGIGFVIETGTRTYFNKESENKNLYMGNFMSYGNIKFEENYLLSEFEGTFSYFSLFSPEIGYKFKAGNFAIDPFVGVMWQWQIKGKGDIDNKNVNNWQPRAGLRIGYQF